MALQPGAYVAGPHTKCERQRQHDRSGHERVGCDLAEAQSSTDQSAGNGGGESCENESAHTFRVLGAADRVHER